MMKDGRPYTNENGWEDKGLITDEPEIVQRIVRAWIVANIFPCKKSGDYHTSYGIKHILEGDTGIYLTNNQFKDAMLLAGFEPVNPDELNWTYRIKKSSPAFQRDFDSGGVYNDFEERHGLSCKVLYDEIRRICREAQEQQKKEREVSSCQAEAVLSPQTVSSMGWNDLLGRCLARLREIHSPLLVDMYYPFLAQCYGTLDNGTLTLCIYGTEAWRRLDDNHVKKVLLEESGAERIIFKNGIYDYDVTPRDVPPLH